MKYQMKVTGDSSKMLEFVSKTGQIKEIYVGHVKEGMLGDRVLSELYDHHQMHDDFADDDVIEVEGVGTFKVIEKIHIGPADEDTKLAVQGVTREKPFRVAYDGMDGHSSESFATLAEAAKYVKDRWQGVDYIDSKWGFHNDYGRFMCFGFKLEDIGTFSGSRMNGDRDFQFKELQPERGYQPYPEDPMAKDSTERE